MPYINIDGVNIFYELKGNLDSEETIVFLNGVMSSTSSWAMQVPLFERFKFKILLHDFRGQLMSDKPRGPYTFKQHAEDAKKLMEELNIKKAHIIGTSYGGEVAMRFAIAYPKRVKSLSIIDSVSEYDEVLRLFVRGWRSAALSNDRDNFYWGILPTIYHNSFLNQNVDIIKARAEQISKAPDDFFQGQVYLYETFENDVYMTDELHKIKSPSLIVCGEEDLIKPRKFSKIIADNIPQSELAIIPDCGHVTIIEKPETLNTLLLGFILKNA